MKRSPKVTRDDLRQRADFWQAVACIMLDRAGSETMISMAEVDAISHKRIRIEKDAETGDALLTLYQPERN